MTARYPAFGALADLRIIDLTQMLAGPYATMMLADHGAHVIKVEPAGGDMARSSSGISNGDRVLGGYFQSIDRNKDSVVLDLKSEVGKAALKALVRGADAIIENFRAGVMEQLGLGFEVLREINPSLVYGAARGFGDPRTGSSPYQHWPAFDVVSQAMGGIMAVTGRDRMTPTKVGPGLGDIVPGMMLAFGVIAAIHHSRRTGRGQFVDVALTDAVLAVCERTVWQHSVDGVVPGPEGDHHPYLCPFGIFPASDGHVAIAAHQDSFFTLLAARIGAVSIGANPRFLTQAARAANRAELIALLADETKKLSKAELAARLGGAVPFGPVMNIADIEADPHFIAREMITSVDEPGYSPIKVVGVPIKMTETPGGVHRRAPLLGEHTRPRLQEAGLSDEEIEHIINRRNLLAKVREKAST